MMRPTHIAVLMLAAGLAACNAAGNAIGRMAEPRFGACPAATILAEAADVTRFSGRGRDITDVHYQARITNVRTSCDYGRAWGRRYAYSRVWMNFEVEMGSVAFPAPVDIPYFVALIRPATEEVLIKEVFVLNVPFSDDRRSFSLNDNIDRIAIPVQHTSEGGNYEIVIGFELSPQEVAFNRRREY